jgi:DNA-binding GntR family transcriptional regulator
MGLVESKPRVGTRVRVPTRQDIEDRSLVREALETQAARLFAGRATAAEKKELRQMGRRVDQLYAACEKSSDGNNALRPGDPSVTIDPAKNGGQRARSPSRA